MKQRVYISHGKFFCLVLLTILGLAIPAKGQFASFRADTNHLQKLIHRSEGVYRRALTLEWRVNGQALMYGTAPVFIQPDSAKLDTILFRTEATRPWDTILCNIRKPGNYEFVYNTCCGGFDLREEGTNRFISGSVVFDLVNEKPDAQYVGTLGEAALFIPAHGIRLTSHCRSAMSPNIYEVTIAEVERCSDTTSTCSYLYCEVDNNDKEVPGEAGFRFLRTPVKFLYMPLDSEPLHVTYDARTGELVVR